MFFKLHGHISFTEQSLIQQIPKKATITTKEKVIKDKRAKEDMPSNHHEAIYLQKPKGNLNPGLGDFTPSNIWLFLSFKLHHQIVNFSSFLKLHKHVLKKCSIQQIPNKATISAKEKVTRDKRVEDHS